MENFKTLAAEAVRKALSSGHWIDVPELREKVVKYGIEQLMSCATAGNSVNMCEPEPVKVDVPTPAVELLAGDRYVPPPIRTEGREYIPGYDWQIIVLSRDKNPYASYIQHFAERPSQADFEVHFQNFHNRTHFVHVHEKINGRFVTITDQFTARFVPAASPDKVVHIAKPPAEPAPLTGRDVSATPICDPWMETDKPFRIRHYSEEAQGIVFTYVDKKPVGREMSKFHHTKCLAACQARPKQEGA